MHIYIRSVLESNEATLRICVSQVTVNLQECICVCVCVCVFVWQKKRVVNSNPQTQAQGGFPLD